MSEAVDGLGEEEKRFQEMKERYENQSNSFLELCSRRSKAKDRVDAFWAWHRSALDLFNSFERLIPSGSVAGADRDPTWFTDKGETAVNLLDTIALHFETAAIKANDESLNSEALRPSRTAFAGIQRIAQATNPKLAQECRDRFMKLGLPTHGFDTDESTKVANTPLEPRFFYVGCGLLLFAFGMVIWGFAIENLSPDRRSLLMWILPLASGFGCWSFAGSIRANLKGWQGLAVSATGGFGVWLISNFLLFPAN